MALFSTNRDEKKKVLAVEEVMTDEELNEELRKLVSTGKPKEVDRTISEAEDAVNEAKKADLYGYKLIEHGRCPVCHGRTENLLFTTVCSACGWFRRGTADIGKCIVHLDTGETIECDKIYHVKGNKILCAHEGVVSEEVMEKFIRRIEYVWDKEELDEAKELVKKIKSGICSWCEKDLSESEEDGPFESYVAFGPVQERFSFCTMKCQESFQKKYQPRIHRNCYENDCDRCDKCIKRYDAEGMKRLNMM